MKNEDAYNLTDYFIGTRSFKFVDIRNNQVDLNYETRKTKITINYRKIKKM